jgi:quinol monooxygenase YgiN
VVIVAGYIDIGPEQRDAFLAGRQEAIAQSRTEDGCLEYVFSADSTEPGRVRVFERWESDQALDAHLARMASAPPAEPASAPDPAPRLGMELLRYSVSGVNPLMPG